MSELLIDIKTRLISGRGKIEKIPGCIKNNCKRAALVRDPNTPESTASAISALLLKKGIDCVIYTDLPARTGSKDAETLASFIKKGFIQCVIGFGGPRTLNHARIAVCAAENNIDVDDILDGAEIPLNRNGGAAASDSGIDYIEIPSSIRYPLMFSSLAAVSDSRNRKVKVIDTGKAPSAVIKDSSVYDRLTSSAIDAICFEIAMCAMEALCYRERHIFTDIMLSSVYNRILGIPGSGRLVPTDELSDLSICSDYPYSVYGPGTGYYMALSLNSLTGVPVSFLCTILLPHLLECYFTMSPEAAAAANSCPYPAGAAGSRMDPEETAAEIRRAIKKKNLPIRLSEAGIKKEVLQQAVTLACDHQKNVKNVLNISDEKIEAILRGAL